MEYHEYANLFPMMQDDQLGSLAESIRKTQQDHPIMIFEGKILDGRNRWMACQMISRQPVTAEYTGSKEEALQYVLDHNLECRRHLTESQRAMIASRLATMRHGRPRAEEKSPIGDFSLASKDRAAAAADLNVGTSSVDRARRAQKTGIPELLKAVDDGELSVNAAVEIAKLPEDRQREVLAEGLEAVKEKAKEIRENGGAEIAPSPDAEYTAPPLPAKYAMDDAERLWGIAKITLEKILPDDISRVRILQEVITYAKKRISSRK
jgi:hypothetical protein